MKYPFFVCLFIFIICTYGHVQEIRNYRSITGAGTSINTMVIQNTSYGFNVTYNQTSKIELNDSYSTLVWHLCNKEVGTDINFERVGDIIIISGKFENQVTAKQLRINNHPWYQAQELALEHFNAGSLRSMKYWVVKLDEMVAYEMEVSRMGDKKIEAYGLSFESSQLKVTLTGIRSLFWQANYWFRKSDGRYVRYESVEGGPGTPLTITELTSLEVRQ
ncbi:MAG: hypothetical protein KKI09_07010 [Spirochaetes bacterium]|nr:hypothetical protein [Spirochaetota bacterium]MBU0955159.1 hypothetical protein [Spirochaetota bacterium]